MSNSQHEPAGHNPEFDPQTIAEIDSSIGEWLSGNNASTPEEAQVNEFKSYYYRLGELPLGINGVSKYEISYADAATVDMWPRAVTPTGKLYDLVMVDGNEAIAIRPFVVIGSLVCQESLDDINDELRASIALQCGAYARSGLDIPVQIAANGLPVLLTPTLCDESYLVLAPVYMTMADRIDELAIDTELGFSEAQPMWRVRATNTSGVEEHFLIEAGAIFSNNRIASAQAHLANGSVEDLRSYISGTEE